MGECRYVKKHSLILISSSHDYVNSKIINVEWCEVCGEVVKTEFVLKNRNWEEEDRKEWTSQIAKEVLAKEKAEAEKTQIAYDEIFYIDDQCLGQ